MPDSATLIHMVMAFSAAICIAIGSAGAALAQGRAVGSACESMARQPELLGELRMTMIIGLAMIESLGIYCLLVSLILLFVKW
ncbi:MAG: ATP synthase F0 subunit C [Candidatus Riflebacteria bacterium]|nr:ATP synthase F0 subunit C [Candidatus Riflebacteria bacterium]